MKKREIRVFDNPKNVKRFLIGFFVVLGLLLVADLFVEKHPDFPWEGVPAFFAVYGFSAYVLLIFVAKLWRRIVKRDEDYYD